MYRATSARAHRVSPWRSSGTSGEGASDRCDRRVHLEIYRTAEFSPRDSAPHAHAIEFTRRFMTHVADARYIDPRPAHPSRFPRPLFNRCISHRRDVTIRSPKQRSARCRGEFETPARTRHSRPQSLREVGFQCGCAKFHFRRIARVHGGILSGL